MPLRYKALTMFLLVLAVCAGVLTWKVCRLVDTTRATVAAVGKQLQTETLPEIATDGHAIAVSVVATAESVDKMRTQVDRMVIVVTGTATNVEKATRSLKAQEDAQALYWGQTAVNVARVTNDADTAIKDLHPVLVNFNTDLVSLNGVLLSAQKGLDELPLTMQLLNADLQKLAPVIDNVGTITKNLGHTTGTLDELVTWGYKKITAPVSRINAAAHVLARYGVEWLAYHF